MKHGKTQRRDRNHHAVKHDELRLILHDRVPPPGRQLRDTIHATREHGDEREDKTRDEHPEARGSKQAQAAGGVITSGANNVVHDERSKAQQGDDLPHDTSDHEVRPRGLRFRARIRAGGRAAAGGLQGEGEQIAADEDPGVEFGAQAGGVGAEFDDDVLER